MQWAVGGLASGVFLELRVHSSMGYLVVTVVQKAGILTMSPPPHPVPLSQEPTPAGLRAHPLGCGEWTTLTLCPQPVL